MKTEIIVSIILILMGLFFLFKSDLIIKITGKSNFGDYSIKQRKEKIIIGGIFLIIYGKIILQSILHSNK